MSRHVNAIAGRLSLRPPQRRSLEILARVTELAPPRKGADPAAALAAIGGEFPAVTDFEREFPSLCFALATGVGKTRLMGAFIAYLHLAHGIRNFFVLAPNLTIYDKLITDFTPNTPKYVFRGIAEFASDAPEIITGDNYDGRARSLFDDLIRCKVNIFNISKINAEVRGGRSPRIKRLSEYIGESYFDYLAGLDDLVVLMDESHRYRASAGVRAINELKPVLGLELTATPFVETGKGPPTKFRNVIFDYPLARAIADGFVKDPAVVTRKDFDPSGMSTDEIEGLKLEDGIRLHEQTKVLLETYAREAGVPIVKPFVLVIARDTTHASALMQLVQSDDFFAGAYRDKVIQVDSSKSGAAEDAMVARLLKVEHADEPTEIVIHVNMLKEGWDVTNLYTIVPLRAANARVLIEQSIGRGLRLPYGQRTGVPAVDRLSIVAHDRFQEILDEARKPDSVIRLQAIVLDDTELAQRSRTVIAQSTLKSALGITPSNLGGSTDIARATAPEFTSPAEQRVAELAYAAILRKARDAERLPRSAALTSPELQAELTREVTEDYRPQQLELEGVAPAPDIGAVVAKATELVILRTIDIPRILVVPEADVRSGFEPFALELSGLTFRPPSDQLWVQYLQSGASEVVGLGKGGIEEQRLEDYVVSGLVDFDDVAYDPHADVLYDLAAQVVAHLRGYLPEDDVRKVLRYHQREIARFVHAQMQRHRWEEEPRYRFEVRSGFVEIKDPAYVASDGERDFRHAPPDKSNMGRHLFGGFSRSLHAVQKFDSDPERVCAIILDREAEKWFRPAKGQFQIYYKDGHEVREYQPDFVAETADTIYMLEVKARRDLDDQLVRVKREAAVAWCGRASAHAASCGGKPWIYVIVPHDRIKENMTIAGLVGVA